MSKEYKVEIILDSPEGEVTYEIWDVRELQDTCLRIAQERLEDAGTYYPDKNMVKDLTYAVDNDLGDLAYKLLLTARENEFPFSSIEFIDEDGNGEDTYEELTEDWSLSEEED